MVSMVDMIKITDTIEMTSVTSIIGATMNGQYDRYDLCDQYL